VSHPQKTNNIIHKKQWRIALWELDCRVTLKPTSRWFKIVGRPLLLATKKQHVRRWQNDSNPKLAAVNHNQLLDDRFCSNLVF
jgi:hypothetical protein